MSISRCATTCALTAAARAWNWSRPTEMQSALPLAKQTRPEILQCNAKGLKPGAYKLKWNVLASDGHMSSGEVPFTVQ